ncbi:hypothetical protein pipiens_018008, partial [Culex pipiens pipiens]
LRLNSNSPLKNATREAAAMSHLFNITVNQYGRGGRGEAGGKGRACAPRGVGGGNSTAFALPRATTCTNECGETHGTTPFPLQQHSTTITLQAASASAPVAPQSSGLVLRRPNIPTPSIRCPKQLGACFPGPAVPGAGFPGPAVPGAGFSRTSGSRRRIARPHATLPQQKAKGQGWCGGRWAHPNSCHRTQG